MYFVFLCDGRYKILCFSKTIINIFHENYKEHKIMRNNHEDIAKMLGNFCSSKFKTSAKSVNTYKTTTCHKCYSL